MKKPSAKARGKVPRPKPFENNKVDFSKFKTDPSTSDIARLTAGIKGWPFPPIEVLAPAKAIGRGRTNLTLLFPLGGDLQTDATVPYAGTGGNATVFVRFEPIAYGITSVAPYQQTYGVLHQLSGASWRWYSTVIQFPDIIIYPPL